MIFLLLLLFKLESPGWSEWSPGVLIAKCVKCSQGSVSFFFLFCYILCWKLQPTFMKAVIYIIIVFLSSLERLIIYMN